MNRVQCPRLYRHPRHALQLTGQTSFFPITLRIRISAISFPVAATMIVEALCSQTPLRETWRRMGQGATNKHANVYVTRNTALKEKTNNRVMTHLANFSAIAKINAYSQMNGRALRPQVHPNDVVVNVLTVQTCHAKILTLTASNRLTGASFVSIQVSIWNKSQALTSSKRVQRIGWTCDKHIR